MLAIVLYTAMTIEDPNPNIIIIIIIIIILIIIIIIIIIDSFSKAQFPQNKTKFKLNALYITHAITD